MKREIIIGGNSKTQTNYNAVRLWYGSAVSNNSEFYILHNNFCSITMFIVKDSLSGKEFGDWISQKENQNNEVVWFKFIQLLSKYGEYSDMKEIFNSQYQKGYEAGKKDKTREIRSALGL